MVIDIFKDQKVLVKVPQKGNAVQIQDLDIGRPIFKILGQISSSNYIQMSPVNYKGRFVYLQLKTFPGKYFQVMLTLAISKTGVPLRMSVGNMHRRH